MKDELQDIVDFLKTLAGDDDMASLQINSEGTLILRVGVQHSEHFKLDQFCTTYPDYKQ